MKIWKIVFVLLAAFSLDSCDKEDENNMISTAIESIASTQWSLNRQATHREGKTVIEKFDTESMRRVLTLVDADGFAKYYSISSNKANQMSLRQTLGGTQTILELTKIITIR